MKQIVGWIVVLLWLPLVACEQQAVETVGEPSAIRSELLLQGAESWNEVPISYPDGRAEISIVQIEIAPGSETDWHLHPMPSAGYLISGELEVTLRETGETVRMRAGDTVLEVVNTAHRGRSLGDEPARLLVFYAGAEGMDLTLPAH